MRAPSMVGLEVVVWRSSGKSNSVSSSSAGCAETQEV
jgi:hypothetical protein